MLRKRNKMAGKKAYKPPPIVRMTVGRGLRVRAPYSNPRAYRACPARGVKYCRSERCRQNCGHG